MRTVRLIVALCGLCAGASHAQIQPTVVFDPHDAVIQEGSILNASLSVSIAGGEYIGPFHREFGYTLLGISGRIFSGTGVELPLPPLPAGASSYQLEASFEYPDSGFYDYGSDGLVTYGWWSQVFLDGSTTFITTQYPFNQYYEVEVLANGALPVPEPESYAMLLAGLGLLGFAARRAGRAPA